MNLANALKWSFLSEVSTKAIQPVVFIILARLLTPEDFGVMTSALMVIGFSQIFWEAGMGKALIQRQSEVEEAANVAFWINIALGIVIAIFFFIVAPLVADIFFHDNRVTAVLQVMTLQILLGAISSVHTALLQKEMDFKKLFWVRVATVSLPGLASIPLALNGMGYWALVAGTLIGQLAQAIMLWRMNRWRPNLTFHTPIAKEMGKFGAWVGTSGLLAWFYIWADSLIVGMYLGSHELGLYRTGNQLASMCFATLLSPIIPVLYSHLSKMQHDKYLFQKAVNKIIDILIISTIPLAIIIYNLSNPIASILFSSKWKGIELVLGVLSLMHGFSWIVGMNGEFYRAMGKPAYETIVTSCTLFIYYLAYAYSITIGFEVFIWTRLALGLGSIVLHIVVLNILIDISPCSKFAQILKFTIITIIATILTSKVLSWFSLNTMIYIFIKGLLITIIVLTMIYLFDRDKIFTAFNTAS